MKNRLFLSAIFGAALFYAAASSPIQTPDCGNIERLEVVSPQLNDTIDVDIWLPEGFDRSQRYPVLYMHDGQNLYDSSTTWNHQSWEMDSTVCRMIAEGKIPPIIIVGIHSDPATRVSQLMPQKAVADAGLDDLMAEVKLKGMPVLGDKYADFVVSTLKPLIDASYPTLSDQENTNVMGSSMGGLMSLYLISEYPEVFGGAACLSTHWYGSLDAGDTFGNAMMNYVDSRIPDPTDHRLYFDHGTSTIDVYYGPWETQALLLAQKKGYIYGKNLDSFIDYGAPHEESAWAARGSRPLTFLFAK
ncbi:MAG: esterase family protein [Muribaculaceae bacterium]|nr:esterase family protein [Muribaculaceae bacterium]